MGARQVERLVVDDVDKERQVPKAKER